MTPTDGPAGPDDDMDRWLDEMAGRRPPSDDAARVLREVVASHAEHRAQHQLDAFDTPETRQRASARLRDSLHGVTVAESGLVEGDAPATVRPRGAAAANDHRWRLVAGLGVLVVAAGVFWKLTANDGDNFKIANSGMPVWRDLRDPIQVSVVQPTQAAQVLARQVAPFDSRPLLFRELDTIVVDFDIQPARLDEVVANVADARIKAAVRPGSNRVVFSKTP